MAGSSLVPCNTPTVVLGAAALACTQDPQLDTPRASAKPKPIVKPPPAPVDCDNNAFYMGPEGKLILRPECK